ncbi:type 2 lanthipeptide synthetase LanM family protein [Polyangium sorediatum]|uniref:Type 2 lanthipeptide synthetase LanM family protein n=1 Tax=Polyangium sorediatum TaxID=889274 RepID=A0ABT6NTE5_9BACT|nr:type 2 lanthipeptide synthetase LanM family protein [Polyangium sorediatum]MDI1431417.1 type 2 lanthipeptide synthetase LanM family protein [Polyangium sorediatum]
MAHAVHPSPLAEIFGRASTIAERLSGDFSPVEDARENEKRSPRLQAWCEAVAKGDRSLFQRRLAWDGLNEAAVLEWLGAVRPSPGAQLPAWAELLADVLKGFKDPAPSGNRTDDRERFVDPEKPFPFQEILFPFVLAARQRLLGRAGACYDLLTDASHAALENRLLDTLANHAALPLQLEFSVFRVRNGFAAKGPAGRELYRAFVLEMDRGGLSPFLQEYAVLARLLASTTHFWVEATAEFLEHLSADLGQLEETFGGGRGLGRVERVQASLSDPHRGQRCVIGVSFASGVDLFYKPKDLGIDEAFRHLVAWLNDRGLALPLTAPRLLRRPSHGWVERVPRNTCDSADEIRRYYQRGGALLCLVHVLAGRDCHFENLIANGDTPVLIDLETLLHPRARTADDEGMNAAHLTSDLFVNSVLGTGMIPTWQVAKDGQVAFDLSGLSGIGDQEAPFRMRKWGNVNSDGMEMDYEVGKIHAQGNAPLLRGSPVGIGAHIEDLVAGFTQMYRFLERHRRELLSPEGPIHAFKRQRVRFIYRATAIYASVFKKLLLPKHLRSGVDASIVLEILGRDRIAHEERPVLWALLPAEIRALVQGDIPFFSADPASDRLEVSPGEHIDEAFLEPSFHLVLGRLSALGDDDLAGHTALIRGALYAYIATEVHEDPSAPGEKPARAGHLSRPPAGFVEEAVRCADELRKQAIKAKDGSISWFAPRYMMQAGRYRFQSIGWGLYDGVCGVAIFFSALNDVAGAAYGKLALAALEPVLQLLRRGTSRQRFASQLGISGATGLASVLYSLVQVGKRLGHGTLIDAALEAAPLITMDRIAADQALDIIGGSASAILGLLALHRETGAPSLLERAVACGEHLLAARRETPSGHRLWPAVNGRFLTGFSHGAAGVCYALLRLHEATRETTFRGAAEDALAYERSVFDADQENWPDLRGRETDVPAFGKSWCHGAVGIGLSRLGGLHVLATPDIRQDIDVALRTVKTFDLHSADHLCCGNFGRVELFLVAARRLGQPTLQEHAGRLAGELVERAAARGGFSLFPPFRREVPSPGFFQGMSGIGYTLLRLHDPNMLPSVLLWE